MLQLLMIIRLRRPQESIGIRISSSIMTSPRILTGLENVRESDSQQGAKIFRDWGLVIVGRDAHKKGGWWCGSKLRVCRKRKSDLRSTTRSKEDTYPTCRLLLVGKVVMVGSVIKGTNKVSTRVGR